MTRTSLLASLFIPLLLASGCAHRQAVQAPQAPGVIVADAAVRAAQDDPARGITGTFALKVQAIGSDQRMLYLSSERDYRHPLNISLAISPTLQPALEDTLGVKLATLQGRRILVNGTARRVRIAFISGNGQPSNKYYYQTQIRVTDPGQVQLAP
ncbi:hypothetical protein [Stenotrophomonas sp. NPDC077659]|uniref:hypothetical protein n=1 Tax=Stenotrophomonas sp. NPDC077659 TaxID=3390694 RepID=UPI003CFE0809